MSDWTLWDFVRENKWDNDCCLLMPLPCRVFYAFLALIILRISVDTKFMANYSITYCVFMEQIWISFFCLNFQVWQNYTCMVSSSGLCTTVGRVIPDIYRQMVAAVNESYALEYYTPVLLSLQDCKFVRDTFLEITSSHCPPLEHYLKIVNAGLGLISVGVLLCLVLWILYANCPLMEEVFAKISSPIKCSRGCAGVKIGSSSSGKNDASLSITSVV